MFNRESTPPIGVCLCLTLALVKHRSNAMKLNFIMEACLGTVADCRASGLGYLYLVAQVARAAQVSRVVQVPQATQVELGG